MNITSQAIRIMAIASTCLLAWSAPLKSIDHFWIGTTNLTGDPANWNPATVPVFGDNAIFDNTGLSTTPLFSGLFNPDLVAFSDGTRVYTLTETGVFIWGMSVTGFKNTGLTPNVVIDGGAGLIFSGSASGLTNDSTGPIDYSIGPTSSSAITFRVNSTAGGTPTNFPSYILDNGSSIQFLDASTGGFAFIDLLDSSTMTIDHDISLNAVQSDSGSTMTLGGELTYNLQGGETITDAGVITDGLTSGSIIVQGDGTLILQGTNTYSGGTTVIGNQADVQVSSDANLGNPAGSVTLQDNGALTIVGASNFVSSRPFILNNGGIIDVESPLAFSATLNGPITGTGPLTKIGPGLLILGGANTYSNGTIVNAGILQGTTSSLQGPISLNTGTLVDFNQNFTGTYSGTISGPGGVVINGNGGTGDVIFTGTNTFTGGLFLLGGTLSVSSDASLGAPTGLVTFNGGTLEFLANVTSSRPFTIMGGGGTIQVNATTDTLSGNITGPGHLTVTGSTLGTLILTGTNSYSGGTTINGPTLQGTTNSLQGNIVDNGALVFDQSFNGTYAGNISGTGSVSKNGTGLVIFTGTNSYTGGTFVNAGTLQGNTNSLQGTITDNAALIFNQTTNGTFNGTLLGNGTVTKIGGAVLTINTNNSGFTGTTFINQGTLNLNSILGGNVIDNSILTGNATILGNLTVNSGATISPGNNSIGSISVGGNFVENAGSTYLVDFNGAGSSDIIHVTGTATINGGDVKATSLDGNISLSKEYTILHADGGRTGTYDSITAFNVPFQPILLYDPNNVFMSFGQAFINMAETPNQHQAAEQIASITNPTPAQQALINELIHLTDGPLLAALTQLSGEQFTNLYVLAENSSERFVKMLYDPLRSILNVDPRCRCYCDEDMGDVWVQVGRSRTTYDAGQFVRGLQIQSTEVGLGFQNSSFCEDWTLGFAGYYQQDRTTFSIGGLDKSQTAMGGFYSLYHPCNYYVMADFVAGVTNHRFRRPINVGDIHLEARSDPKVIQAMGYLEVGADSWLGVRCNWLSSLALQPFVGFGFGVYNNRHFDEIGADPVNLDVPSQTNGSAYSRVGLHLTAVDLWQFLDVGIDAAWQCRLSPLRYDIDEHFIGFGTRFPVIGFVKDFSTIDGRINLATHLDEWSFFIEAAGTAGTQVSSYTYMGGLSVSW